MSVPAHRMEVDVDGIDVWPSPYRAPGIPAPRGAATVADTTPTGETPQGAERNIAGAVPASGREPPDTKSSRRR